MDTQAKHTPGPWKVGEHPGDGSGSGWRKVLSEGGTFSPAFVCNAYINDAHLIAAAPDLLEELKHMRATLCAELDKEQDGSGYDRCQQALEKAALAIAKAEGRV